MCKYPDQSSTFGWYKDPYHMCSLCFNPIFIDNLYIDSNNIKWDVCISCIMKEILLSIDKSGSTRINLLTLPG